MNEIARLTELCEQWGGKLRLLAPEPGSPILGKILLKGWQDWGARGKHHAPFSPNLGVNWKRKIVYAMVDSERFKEPFWPRIIHEMAHNHASRVNPRRVDEWSFFGWELAVVKYIGGDQGQWEYDNRDYAISNNSTEVLGRCSRRTKERIYAERIQKARNLGILNKRFEPISIR